ncbi:putative cellulose synthase-like protein D5 [Hordeum vulgare]|nr:putative cellulose synthase-like protein D5 [Hordeum vulgare]
MSSDYTNYTVFMPPTPDNQPGAAPAPASGGSTKPDNLPLPRYSSGSKLVNRRSGDDGAATAGGAKMDRRLSTSHVASPSKSLLVRSQTGEFDHNRWLFETQGTYGIGNAYWPQDDNDDGAGMGGGSVKMEDLVDKPWKPLSRKVPIPPGILSPYRLLVLVRFVALSLFLIWRATNPNPDAMWLWGISIVCEYWFAFSWLLDQMPKLNPINRAADLAALREKFESKTPSNPTGRSDLPGLDVFISTADPYKEPPLVTANTLLSILATDYPVEKLFVYISDDGGALLTFEAMAEACAYAKVWVPFCRKHSIEPRNPEAYFTQKGDPTKGKKRPDFVKDRRWIKREYDEYKVRINDLPEAIRRRAKAMNAQERKIARDKAAASSDAAPAPVKATWMADGTHWPGTWLDSAPDHGKGDHASIVQVMIKNPHHDVVYGDADDHAYLDFTNVDVRIPMFVYLSREKRPGYDHNKKAGAMNAMVRASAILSNGPFMLNFDCDHYVYNCQAIREAMCYMLDRGGDRICYIQFRSDSRASTPPTATPTTTPSSSTATCARSTASRDQCMSAPAASSAATAIYGFNPPRAVEYHGVVGQTRVPIDPHARSGDGVPDELRPLSDHPDHEAPQRFGKSKMFIESIAVAEYQGRPLADHPSVRNGRPPGALLMPRPPLDAATVAESVSVISCWYEDNTEWGLRVGWIYGSVTEDVVTGYRMHNRGWRSVYCITKRDAFRGTAPINLTDRLHQVLRWATGSVEIFFSKNNALLASRRLMFLQRMSYLNVGIYPFTSLFLIMYCLLPALSLFSGQFIVATLDPTFLCYLLLISITLMLLCLLEVKWSGIGLEEWWRNEQFWVIGGTSAHLAAVLQGLLKVAAGIEISFTLTAKAAAEDDDDPFAELYLIKWTSLFIPPLAIIGINIIAMVVGVSRCVYAEIPQYSKLLGGGFFSFWVLAHYYPFAKGLMGRRGRTPTIVYVWAGLISITVSLLWITISPPDDRVSQSGIEV